MPQVLARDGAPIAYDDAGQGRPLLLVHGWATHGGFFRPQMAGLSDRFRVIAPDLRGHGRSHRPGDRPTVAQLAEDIADLAAALDLGDMVVAGWSMGALVLWQALLDGLAPRVAGMAVIDMAPKVVNTDGWDLGLRGSHPARSLGPAADAMRADWPQVSRRAAHRIFAPDLPQDRPDMAAWAVGEIGAADADAMAHLWLSLAALDFRPALPRLPVPSLVLHGLRSRLYGAETAAYLTGLLPRARRLGLERSGHAPHLEEPDAVNAALAGFAATLPRPPPAPA